MANTWFDAPAACLSLGWRRPVHTFAAVVSTNDTARGLAQEGVPSGAVVLAESQEAGRGREGRNWSSPPRGGVYLSMILDQGTGLTPPLAAVVAGADIARELTRLPAAGGRAKVQLKWPNDLIVDDRKLGGILVESGRGPGYEHRLVIGVGINLRREDLPAEFAGSAVAFDEFAPDVDAVDVAGAVIRGIDERVPSPPRSLGDAALAEIADLDWLWGRRVRVTTGAGRPELRGVAAGIASDGALLIRSGNGELSKVTAGTVRAEP